MRRAGSGTDLTAIRPGSRDGGTKGFMARLPDEQPVGIAFATEGVGSRPTSKSGSRPSSRSGTTSPTSNASQQGGALVRLADEPTSPGGSPLSPGPVGSPLSPALKSALSGTSTAPGSAISSTNGALKSSNGGSTNGQRVSLSRLPESAMDACPATSSTADAIGGLRARMKQGLSIATAKEDVKADKPKAFRALKAGETIEQFYDFGDQIHDGGPRGKVSKAFRVSDRKEVVIKARAKKSDKSGERAWREVMSQLHAMRHIPGASAHVLDILEILEDDKCFFVVMPICEGGELFNFLVTEAEVPESECKRIIREILHAVGHLHDNNLIHRDVKPENILFDITKGMEHGYESPKTVKLIDFDTCMEWTPMTPKNKQFVGTPGYIAPEALLGDACPQSDLWSIGVICYILMTGETPWATIETLEDGTVGSLGANRMYETLKAAVIDWESEPWPDFPLARDLCQKLMAFDAEDRLETCSEALKHPWLAH